jgi:hypothetical protein
MRQSILLAISLCLIANSLSVNGANIEIKEIKQVNFNIQQVEQWWKNINTFIGNQNPDLSSLVKSLVNNTLANLNDYQKYIKPEYVKVFNDTKQCVEIAKQILGLNVNSYSELVKAVSTLPKDPVSLGLRIAQVAFAKELKKADQEVVKRLTLAINNIQDPNLKAVIKFVAENPFLIERVFGKDATKEPVTRLVNFLARLV